MKYDHFVVHNPSLPATQLFLLFHAAGDKPVAMGQIGSEFAKAFPRALVVSIGAPEPDHQWFRSSVREEEQTRVAEALPGFIDIVHQWQRQSGVRAEATALIGFSQGSTMILEAVAQRPDLAGRVVAFSGRYASLPHKASTRTTIHLIHGDNDVTVPLTHAVDAQERLMEMGGDVTLDIIDDLPHAIDDRAVNLALERLQFTVPRRYFDEALGGGRPGDDDVIALM